jgi:hypothetical protein
MNCENFILGTHCTDRSDPYTAEDSSTASAMSTEALIEGLAACCLREDCPTKRLEAAILAEAIYRMKHPFSWRLRRWWHRYSERHK